MSLHFSVARPVDGLQIQLRPEDLAEATVWCPGAPPEFSLATCIAGAVAATTVRSSGSIVAIYGYSLGDRTIHPWLMCSAPAVRHGKAILKLGRKLIRDLRREYPGRLIGNYVASGNTSAKRLLHSLGFRWVPSPGTGGFDFFFLPNPCV